MASMLFFFFVQHTRQYEERDKSKTYFLPLSLVLLFGHCSRLMSRKEKAKKAIVVRQEEGRKRGHSMPPPLSSPLLRLSSKQQNPFAIYRGGKRKKIVFSIFPLFSLQPFFRRRREKNRRGGSEGYIGISFFSSVAAGLHINDKFR